ncbi:MAG: hypothetical protein CMA07_06085 [Euryarchaeota archaeon]|jgi:hypothetical protein|nr:hypothetical protein [Euryarchaeota archaeon]|tara:strand:- start:71 stop:889 length:819 start_codon:yes stop_codon:yes gene_type:complete
MSSGNYIVVKSKTGNEINSIIVSDKDLEQLEGIIREVIASYGAYDYLQEEPFIKSMIWQAICLSNIITLTGYQEVLVIPSWRDSNFSTLYNQHEKKVRDNLVSNLWPIINAYFDQTPNVYIAFPVDHESFMKELCITFGAWADNEYHFGMESNKRFVMGDDTFEVYYREEYEDETYDAVVLCGQDVPEGTVFDAQDIKNDLKYSTGLYDTVLIDIHQPSADNRIMGTTRDTREIFEYINNNTVLLDSSDLPELGDALPNMASTLQQQIRVYD